MVEHRFDHPGMLKMGRGTAKAVEKIAVGAREQSKTRQSLLLPIANCKTNMEE